MASTFEREVCLVANGFVGNINRWASWRGRGFQAGEWAPGNWLPFGQRGMPPLSSSQTDFLRLSERALDSSLGWEAEVDQTQTRGTSGGLLWLQSCMRGSRAQPGVGLPLAHKWPGRAWEEDGSSDEVHDKPRGQLVSTCLPLSAAAAMTPFPWPVGVGAADSHHGVVHVHHFAAA